MRRIAILLSVALLAAACASSANVAIDVAAEPSTSVDVDATTTAAPTTTTTTTEAPTTTTTTEAPLVYNLVGGGQLEPGDLEAQDTVLWFWAPW